jgi:Ni,Fe-hydrogenase I cytochrome b subunit
MLNTIILFIQVLKILYFMKVSANLAKIVKLTMRVFSDVSAFTFFLLFWMLVFVKLYIIAGINLFDKEYQNSIYTELSDFVALFIQCFRNSMGDIIEPTYYYWTNNKDSS